MSPSSSIPSFFRRRGCPRRWCRLVVGFWGFAWAFTVGSVAGQTFQWSGAAGNDFVTSGGNWSTTKPDLYNGVAQDDRWLFAVDSASDRVDVNQNNVRLAGLDFQVGSGSYTVTNRALDLYGFTDNGVTYGMRNVSGRDQTIAVEDIDLFSSQIWLSTNARTTIAVGTEIKLNNSTLTFVGSGNSGFTVNDFINGNGRVLVDGGAHTFTQNVNSAGFDWQGGSTTTYTHLVAANNATNTVSEHSTVVFGGGLNSQKLVVEECSLVLFTGSREAVLNNGGLIVRGGTILLDGDELIGQGTDFTFEGGLFDTQGHSDHSMGTVTLSDTSTLDLGDGASVLKFKESYGENWDTDAYLQITEWDGLTQGNGTDQVYFGVNGQGLTSSQLSRIVFENPAGFADGWYSARQLASGEIVPDQWAPGYEPVEPCDCDSGPQPAPVPEPRSYALGLLFLLAGIHAWRRHRRARTVA